MKGKRYMVSNPAHIVRAHTQIENWFHLHDGWFFLLSLNFTLLRNFFVDTKVASNLQVCGRIFLFFFLVVVVAFFRRSLFSGKIHLRFTVNPITREWFKKMSIVYVLRWLAYSTRVVVNIFAMLTYNDTLSLKLTEQMLHC